MLFNLYRYKGANNNLRSLQALKNFLKWFRKNTTMRNKDFKSQVFLN